MEMYKYIGAEITLKNKDESKKSFTIYILIITIIRARGLQQEILHNAINEIRVFSKHFSSVYFLLLLFKN